MRLAPAIALRGHQGAVNCLASCPTVRTALATGSADKTARVWDLRASRCARAVRGMQDAVNSVAWGGQGTLLYVAESNRVHVFDLRRPDLILSTSDGTFVHNEEEINQIAVNETEEWMAVCDDAGEIQIIDVRNNTLAKTLGGVHENICSCVCVRPRYPTGVISGGFDCNIAFWDINTSRPKHLVDTGSLQGGGQMINPPFVNCLSVTHDGHYIAAGLGNCSIACFSEQVTGGRGKKGPARKRKELAQTHVLYNGHMGGVSSISFLPPRPAPEDLVADSLDALTLSMGGGGSPSRTTQPATDPELEAALQSGNRLLISGGNDRNICVWDLVAAGQAITAMTTLDPLATPGLVTRVEHGHKVNWVVAGWLDHSDAFVAVADPTSVVQLYSILQ